MSEESQGYFELLNAFRAASYQGTGAKFISAHPELTSIRSPHVGETVLHFVAIENEVQAVKELAAAGADADCCDGSQTTPLMSSVKLGHFEMASLLLALGADVHARDNAEQTVMHHWCARPKEEILDLLLSAGADIHAVDDLGETPLGRIYTSIGHRERYGPSPRMSAEGLAQLGFPEETVRQFRELQEKVDFNKVEEAPDFHRARELLLAAGADPENLGWGCVEAW